MQRRDFLRILGLSGAAFGVGAGIGGRSLLAEGGAGNAALGGPIRRLLLVSHCHGWTYDSWKIRPKGIDDSKPFELDLTKLDQADWSKPLQPLFEHRHRILPIDALSLGTAELDMDGNRHDTGWVHAWTGANVDFSKPEAAATQMSLDQLIATHISRKDRLPSLEMSINDSGEPGRPVSYDAKGARLPLEADPIKVWQRIFGPSANPNPLTGGHREALNYAWREYSKLAPKLDPIHRQRLEGHYDLVHRLSQRLEGMANLSCDGAIKMPGATSSFDERFDTMVDLVGAAFSCDVTRVATLSLGEMKTDEFGADHISDNVHKGIAHSIYDNVEKHGAMTNYLHRHAKQMARLVQVLSDLPDPQGGSVMDHTLIVWGSELGDPWHGYWHYCPVLIGGDWHFNTGRYVYRPHETPIEVLVPSSAAPDGYSEVSGLPHQHLLVSTAQAMGLELDHVGIERTQGQRGDHVDCRGPIPGLTG
ncbi:MAG TPA: hypothetical protein DCQ06_10970 [Myxococcales bacterium]|nr:hypothetical protein [Myxococcales bacterium]HAN32109.1 hypothetical protein [Myxococcales bacterium]